MFGKARREAEAAREERRLAERSKAQSADLVPINPGIALDVGEEAYFIFGAERAARIESMQQVANTTSTTVARGGVTRTLVGGALFGPVGAVAGAVSARKVTTSETQTSNRVEHSVRTIDRGRIVFTDTRILFVGSQEILGIPYPLISEYTLNDYGDSGTKLSLKYPGALPEEHFVVLETQSVDIYMNRLKELREP